MKELIEISVRSLVEFILRSGDINRKKRTSPENAMLEGSRIHKMIQRRMGPDYRAEVMLAHKISFDDFELLIEGRADGIIEDGSGVTIDEIKGVYQNLKYLEEPVGVHLAQAKVYAAIYAVQNQLETVNVRMTYCNLDTEELKYFHYSYTAGELAKWFGELLDEYAKWAQFSIEWARKRDQSIKTLEFPYQYRDGQKELAAGVYRTIYHSRRLFLEAPTGVGKTLAVLFPTIKAMGEGLTEKIFYLTAKTITASVAVDTFELLRESGLVMKAVNIVAREKMCLLDEVACNPESCPYAKGHFDRVNDALFEMLNKEDSCTRSSIIDFAREKCVCPFEFALDLSNFADAVVCDYNYCFDPDVSLKRFFSDGVKHNYVFLIDESHNLVDRAREMYSAELIKEDFLKIKRILKEKEPRVASAMSRCSTKLLELKKSGGEFNVNVNLDGFFETLRRAASLYSDMFEEWNKQRIPIDDELLEFYFQIRSFLNMAERFDEHYVNYTELLEDDTFKVKLFCVDPSKNLRECLDMGRSAVFFSATLLPVQYYIDLLSGDRSDYTVYAPSTFDPSKRGVFVATDVSSKYTRRTKSEYYNIASYIYKAVSAKRGNYMVFFPSYSFMSEVWDLYQSNFALDEIECIMQDSRMNEEEREDFLGHFLSANTAVSEEEASSLIKMEFEIIPDKTLVGFCVLGGIFSEGIDLKNDSLIGAVIVGTGLPLVCHEREILKKYFDEKGQDGFDYAYRYPGMNKVLQAAGRVIRTEEDIGIVMLLDERFNEMRYHKLFPREWDSIKRVTTDNVYASVNKFWEGR
ncbi:MAG: ATP-dependent DNA helicase [Lachnospiraceae bacterium]|nr:ATP-dependent DNA helicase [Lachnospiraceae bacterium]